MLEVFRHDAGKTREEAAFRLHLAVKTLYSYEKGHQIPPPDVICGMTEIYDAPWLPLWHCLHRCPIGMQYGCPIEKETAPCGAA